MEWYAVALETVVCGVCALTKSSPGDDDQYSPEETARRMERGLRRALNTPGYEVAGRVTACRPRLK